MKRSIIFFCLIAIYCCVFQSCNKFSEKGSGLLVTEIRDIDSFSSIKVNVPANIYLTNDQTKLKIETDDNLLDKIVTKTKNSKLSISANTEFKNFSELNIYIYTPLLSQLKINSHCSVFTENLFHCNQLKIRSKGNQNLILQLHCNNLDIKATSKSSIRLIGQTENLKINIKDSVVIQANDFISLNTKVKMQGNCTINTNTIGHLSYKISGSGNIFYLNNPVLSGEKTKLNQVIKR